MRVDPSALSLPAAAASRARYCKRDNDTPSSVDGKQPPTRQYSLASGRHHGDGV